MEKLSLSLAHPDPEYLGRDSVLSAGWLTSLALQSCRSGCFVSVFMFAYNVLFIFCSPKKSCSFLLLAQKK
jgi:hypothetical protein